MRRIAVVVLAAGCAALAGCKSESTAPAVASADLGSAAAQADVGVGDGAVKAASADPVVLSNVMDCSQLTLAQRQVTNLYRYGCDNQHHLGHGN